MNTFCKIILSALIMPCSFTAVASDGQLFSTTEFYGIRYEMIIFGLMLVGVAIFYKKTMQVALLGLLALCFYKYEFIDNFSVIRLLTGYTDSNGQHVSGSWSTYVNLSLMLPGFAVLAKIFEDSNLPQLIPRYLPQGKAGAFSLLVCVFVLSSFLDNIAAAMIGGSIAMSVFARKVHIGYVAAICAASNAGGAGSVVGDTTTTLIWIYGIDPLLIAKAFLPAIATLVFFAYFASAQQNRYQPLIHSDNHSQSVSRRKLAVIIMILAGAISFNYLLEFPSLGIWIAIAVGMLITSVDLKVVRNSVDSTVFLVCLVFAAQLVPIESVPDASVLSTMAIGFVSSVFNNIPLTQLCLIKGGYDWALISFAVGCGGSMIWFGSSAGVAICDQFPKARSFVNWLRYGWHIPVGFLLGFAAYLAVFGWTAD
ncbi:MAG: SLC13 family permease [Succinivibrio sp.]